MKERCQKDEKIDVKKCKLPAENGDKTRVNNGTLGPSLGTPTP